MPNIIVWAILGIIAGFIAEKITKTSMGLTMNLIVGLLGAVVGGWLFKMLGAQGVTGLNVWSIIVASVGAIVLLLVVGAVRKKT